MSERESLRDARRDVETLLAVLRRATELAAGYPPATLNRADAARLLDYIASIRAENALLTEARDKWYAKERRMKEQLRLLRAQARERFGG